MANTVTGGELQLISSVASAFSPSDISGLVWWVDPSQTGTITESSGAVSQIDDLSSSGIDATQGTEANQPTTGTRTLNSLNVLDFDGSSDRLSLASNPLVGESAGHVFYVAQRDADPPSDPAIGPVLGRWGSDGNERDHEPYSDGNVYHGWGRSGRINTGNPTASFTTARLIEIVSTGSLWEYRIDGSTHYTTATNTVAWGGTPYIGSNHDAYYWDGGIGEIVVYSTEITGTDLTNIRAHLSDKWAVA